MNNLRKLGASGFTLTELMFAMAFLAFLLIFVVSAMVQFMAVYNKGLAYKGINQTGRVIFEDITRGIRISGATVSSIDKGRMCVGNQAYVWNTTSMTSSRNKYDDLDGGGDVKGIIRIPDATGSLCSSNTQILPYGDKAEQTIIAPARVAVQQFNVYSADDGGLYHLELVMSTDDLAALNDDHTKCLGGRAGEFCAVATFETDISARR